MKNLLWPNAVALHKCNLGLERVKSFFNYLGNPEKKLPPIFHVAGTNGKGSTTAFLKRSRFIKPPNAYQVSSNF